MNVVVIGGGVAGIVAALDCAEAGAAVTLVEVRPRLGGAAYSVERDGLWLDNGQHVFLRCCTAYRALLHKLGSEPLVEVQEALEIPVLAPGRPDAVLRRSGARPPLHLARALLRYPHLSLRERIAAGRAAGCRTILVGRNTDAREIRSASRSGAKDRAAGELARAKADARAEDLPRAAAWILAKLGRSARGEVRRSARRVAAEASA